MISDCLGTLVELLMKRIEALEAQVAWLMEIHEVLVKEDENDTA